MRVLGIVGWSGAGKTTLIVALLPLLRARGLSVSTIKHAHHGFDIDRPGKDSYRHRQAGAQEVLVASARRWVLLHENPNENADPGLDLDTLLGRLAPVDLVLVEGFKSHPGAKLEVYRSDLGKPPLWPDMADITAVASDRVLPLGHHTQLPLDRPDIIAEWIIAAPAPAGA